MKLAEKINGNRKTEREYRQLPSISQSMLVEYDTNREKFYKKYLLGEDKKERKSDIVTGKHHYRDWETSLS